MLSDKDESMDKPESDKTHQVAENIYQVEKRHHLEKRYQAEKRHQLEKTHQPKKYHRSEKEHQVQKRNQSEGEKEVKIKVKRKIYWIMFLRNVNNKKRGYAFTTDEDVSYMMLWQKMTMLLGADVREITYDRGFRQLDVIINSDESLALAIEYMGRKIFEIEEGIELNVQYYNDHLN